MNQEKDLSDYGISPSEGKIEQIEEKISGYKERSETVYKYLDEHDKASSYCPEYSKVFSAKDSFFIHTNPFWAEGEDPELAYLESREDILNKSEPVIISTIEVDLESTPRNEDFNLYLDKGDDTQTYWRFENQQDLSGDVREEADNITEFVNNRLESKNDVSWGLEERI